MDAKDESTPPARHSGKPAKPASLTSSLLAQKGEASAFGFASAPAMPQAPDPAPTGGTPAGAEADSDDPSAPPEQPRRVVVKSPDARPERTSAYVARRIVEKDTDGQENRKTILIVEDYRLNTKLFRDLLEIAGYRTLQTDDGVAAFDLTRSHRPDLILMDIRLPQVSGLEVVHWIRQDPQLRHIPIVAVTAFAMEGDESQILGAGCNAYLRKPISIASFLATIRGFLGNPEEQVS